ncbi:MAG TPA: carboxypeptidase-like regulatory domain-containing protein, partial [Rhodothermales bacterium]
MALAVCSTSIRSFAGDIVGQVTDANTRGYLPGVLVQVTETKRTASTDREGRFRISGVDEGDYTLRVRYIGYDDVFETVQVPATGIVRTEIVLGTEVIELETMVVEGYREARSMALQQKKSVGNIMDIVSADSVGSLPDRNIADALARMPGLSLDVSGGEGRFVTIRGIDPNLNQVTFNGATMAAPGVNAREGRSMPLDVVGSSQISQIEVIKSVTPDMDANALGGSVNIVSASGFDRKERFIFGSAELGTHDPAGQKGPGVSDKVSSDSIYSFDITYGDRLGANDNIGLVLSANYSKRHYQAHDLQANWGTLDGQPYMSAFELLPEDGERERLGLNMNLEFRPDDNAEFYVRAIYNEFNEERAEDEIIFGTGSPTLIAPRVVEFGRVRPERRTFVEETEQTLYNISVGGNRRFGDLTAMADVTYSFAEELNPIIASVQFRPRNINMPAGNRMQIDFSEFYPKITRHADLLEVPETYELRRFREEDSTVEEKTWSPRFDLKWDFDQLFGGRSGFFKTGVKYTTRDRFVDDNSARPGNGSLTLTDHGAALPGDG